ncbi:MAG: hypothetical protein ACI9H8_000711 [Lysobacterales bacterium]|jgi:hypothetical protein
MRQDQFSGFQINFLAGKSTINNLYKKHILIFLLAAILCPAIVLAGEASHLLMGRTDPVWQAFDKAASDLAMPISDGLWHAVLFYTTGEIVRRALLKAGEPPYTPMIYGIYKRSPWGRFEEAIESSWPAYLDGKTDLSSAAINLLRLTNNTTEE